EARSEPVRPDETPHASSHRVLRGGAGKRRWKESNRAGSPSTSIALRSKAAIAFCFPLATRSETALSARTMQFALALRRETVTVPFSSATSQRAARLRVALG